MSAEAGDEASAALSALTRREQVSPTSYDLVVIDMSLGHCGWEGQ